MAKRRKPAKKEKVTVVFRDLALIDRIDQWGPENHFHNRSNAIEALVAWAFKAQDQAKAAQAAKAS